LRGGALGEGGEQDGELLAAPAAHEVGLAERLGQPPRDVREDAVAHGVAEPVVDGLEVVHVEERDGEVRPRAARALDLAVASPLETGTRRRPTSAGSQPLAALTKRAVRPGSESRRLMRPAPVACATVRTTKRHRASGRSSLRKHPSTKARRLFGFFFAAECT